MNNITIIIFFLILNFLLFFNLNKISKSIKIFDYPDNNRKIHNQKVPLVGGIFFFINIFAYLFIEIFFINIGNLFLDINEILSFFLGSLFFFILGLYDDKYKLKPNIKLIFSIIIIFICLNFSDKFIVSDIRFLFLDIEYNLNKLNIVFTIFCILVFLNSFNMIDGINGLSVSYFLICMIYIFSFSFFNIFFFCLLICAFFFLINNFRNRIFLGDNGSLLLGFVLSLFFIKEYNEKKIYADQIIVLMILPGIDMIRVAIQRSLQKKHPFIADQNHLHHILLKKYNSIVSYFVITGSIVLISLVSIFFDYNLINLLCISIIIIIYFLFITYVRLK